jgi:hypothetical protein
MRLIDPQPMETLPETGDVYVECQHDLSSSKNTNEMEEN